MKEGKTKHRYCLLPCAVFDVERIESWLTDMAAQGWHLKDVASSINLFRFAQGSAQQVRYRLEPKRDYNDQSEKPEEAVREVYEACGWEAVADFRPFFIFRTDDPTVRELHTDPEMHLEVYKRLLRRFSWTNIFAIALAVACFVFVDLDLFRRLVVMGPGFTLGYLLLLPFMCVEAIWQLVNILRLYRQLKKHHVLDHRKPWRKRAFWHRLKTVIEKLLYISFVVSLISPFFVLLVMDQPLEEYPGKVPIVTIADMLPEGKYTPDDMLNLNGYEEISTPMAKINLSWTEDAYVVMPDGEVISGLLLVEYHETAGGWVAMGLAKEYLQEALKDSYYYEIELPPLDVDFAAAYGGPGSPTVILCKGNKVVRATINFRDNQAEMFDLWIGKMVDMLNE